MHPRCYYLTATFQRHPSHSRQAQEDGPFSKEGDHEACAQAEEGAHPRRDRCGGDTSGGNQAATGLTLKLPDSGIRLKMAL